MSEAEFKHQKNLFIDKSAGGKFLNEFNENCSKLQDYCDTLAAEVDARKDIIHLLTDAYTSCTASISQLVQTIKVIGGPLLPYMVSIFTYMDRIFFRTGNVERVNFR